MQFFDASYRQLKHKFTSYHFNNFTGRKRTASKCLFIFISSGAFDPVYLNKRNGTLSIQYFFSVLKAVRRRKFLKFHSTIKKIKNSFIDDFDQQDRKLQEILKLKNIWRLKIWFLSVKLLKANLHNLNFGISLQSVPALKTPWHFFPFRSSDSKSWLKVP